MGFLSDFQKAQPLASGLGETRAFLVILRFIFSLGRLSAGFQPLSQLNGLSLTSLGQVPYFINGDCQ